MLKDSQTPKQPNRRAHRTYAPEFKANMVAACQKPGASIASLATANAMNANVLHRWLQEHARTGDNHYSPKPSACCHRGTEASTCDGRAHTLNFIFDPDNNNQNLPRALHKEPKSRDRESKSRHFKFF